MDDLTEIEGLLNTRRKLQEIRDELTDDITQSQTTQSLISARDVRVSLVFSTDNMDRGFGFHR